MNTQHLINIDQQHLWHPYSAFKQQSAPILIEHAEGIYLYTAQHKKLIDGMASWWAVIHGYNHPRLNQAAKKQIDNMSHIMFGGLTHRPAIELAQNLLSLLPKELDKIFYADSGSVAVEVALKMAIQYHHSQGNPNKNKFLSLKKGYHGDTWHAMSVCDPETGMHRLFKGSLPKQHFLPQPPIKYHETWHDAAILPLKHALETHHQHIAALILEPIVQGAGGMYFYHPEYLRQAQKLCAQYNVLTIYDEIATGFGRTGKYFAYEHAQTTPDILCLGKALTGGYLTLAATITTPHIAHTISQSEAKCFMHGPTFMANPLACAIANASITLLKQSAWQEKIQQIETQLKSELKTIAKHPAVKETRALGAIGVIEMKHPVDTQKLTPHFIKNGIWLRPFGKLIYTMPPYIIESEQLSQLLHATHKSIKNAYD